MPENTHEQIIAQKNLQDALQTLHEANTKFYHPLFIGVLQYVEQMIRTVPEGIEKAKGEGRPVKAFIYSILANRTADIIESGELHVYRGVLGISGELLMEVLEGCVSELVRMGDVSPDSANHIMQSVINNIKRAG